MANPTQLGQQYREDPHSSEKVASDLVNSREIIITTACLPNHPVYKEIDLYQLLLPGFGSSKGGAANMIYFHPR